jgi:hypothetical protein
MALNLLDNSSFSSSSRSIVNLIKQATRTLVHEKELAVTPLSPLKLLKSLLLNHLGAAGL